MIQLQPKFFFPIFLLFLCCNNAENKNELPKKKNTKVLENIKNDSLKISSKKIILTKDFQTESKQDDEKNKHNHTEINASVQHKEVLIFEKQLDSPLKKLLKYGEIGKTYSKKELIEHYNFPKKSLDFVKNITYKGNNTLYFKWGSTWFIEKISDAKFQNGNLTFDFKKNRTHIKGGAIGIKYNKKIYTELVLKNDRAYIPSVKGFYWEIKK